jgi:ATP-dependent Clp protease ATP-binding subunit ClpA
MKKNNAVSIFTYQDEPPSRGASLTQALAERVIGQDHVLASIVPFVQTHEAGLAPEGRPAGVFLLLGPTGTGKTKTVEALAGVLHGDERSVLKINCGEFQMEHEVAKLIGAPPGYLGHRETHPILSQAKLAAATSPRSNLALVLFDEIEKAAPSLTRLLLGVLDKAALRLGDNTTVNFERSLIFFTSNLGTTGMQEELRPALGFHPPHERPAAEIAKKLDRIASHAVRKHFPPEFVNRIDAILTYRPLSRETLEGILRRQLADLQTHIDNRLMSRRFRVGVRPSAFRFLLERGCSPEYGARELKRVVFRHLTQPLAASFADGVFPPGSTVCVEAARNGSGLRFRSSEPASSRQRLPLLLIERGWGPD